ncbi:MAG TPA: FtsH protease activity modulator HflK [Gammaproteobacteria bacterium]|nr:FtsH protease activity modulator HflK [Gammaproteobacteria bacterium]
MPWNEPGNKNNNQDPWGGKRDPGPPDLDKILGNFIRKLRAFIRTPKINGSGNNSNKPPLNTRETGYILGFVLGGLFVLWFLSGFFIVNPAEEAVILRWGSYTETLQPGLHWFARFIETRTLVDVQKIFSFSVQGDFLTKSSDQNDLPAEVVQSDLMKKIPGTADQSKNLVNVELNVQYRISDPDAYLYNLVNPDDTIQQVASGALSDIIGTMKLDDALTTGREFLSSAVLERSREVLKNYNSGLDVIAVTLRKVQAPDQVRAAFNDVNRADQDRSTTIQQAAAYASKVVPIAQGDAARILADATGYQQQVVLNAKANVARYQAVLKGYSTAPEVTRERLYLDTLQTVLQNTTKILVDVNAGNNLVYLPLDKLLKQKETGQGDKP